MSFAVAAEPAAPAATCRKRTFSDERCDANDGKRGMRRNAE
jgi:hypothetical protein